MVLFIVTFVKWQTEQMVYASMLALSECVDGWFNLWCTQWCSLRDTQDYAVYPLGKAKDFRIPT